MREKCEDCICHNCAKRRDCNDLIYGDENMCDDNSDKDIETCFDTSCFGFVLEV